MKFKTALRMFVLAFMAFLCLNATAQTTITIGTGTTSSTTYGPIYRSASTSSFDYSRYGYIYGSSELNIPTGSVIQKVEWYKNTVDTMTTSTYSYLDIWMANTAATTASSTAWTAVTAASTRVFRDSFNLTDNVQNAIGWYEFPITSFTYTGNSLQVALDWNCSAPTASPTSGAFTWLYGTAPATRTFYSNSSTAITTLGSTTALRPNIRITYTYTPPAVDAGLDAIISPNAVSCVGSQSVQVDLKNFGSNTLTSATINWSIDGVAQTPNSWTGSLATGSKSSVTLGSVAITASTSKALKVWTSAPNASSDGAAYNDTLSRTLLSGMSGEYTVGGTGTPDYATLTAALAAVSANGACDDIRLLVHQGTYTGQYSIGSVLGLGPNATLEIVSHPANTSQPVFTYAGTGTTDNFVFQFNNTKYITLDSLVINATGTTYGRVLDYSNNTSYITISNSTLRGVSGTSTSTFMAVVFCNTTSSLDENLTFQNNRILNGAYGLYIYGGSSALEAGNKIKNNIVDSFYYYGIYTYYQQGIEISGNYVRDNNNYTSPRGLYCLYNNSALITKNTVLIGGTSSPFGMYLDYNDGTVANPTIISNNMISMYNTSPTATVNGMEVYSAENNYVANNTISVSGGSATSRALYVYSSVATDTVKAYNNMLANYGSGYALYAGATTAFSASNNNAYYAASGNIAYWGAARTSLSALRTANSMDANSIVTTPLFASTTDLHTTSADLDASAKVLSYVTQDIDGDTRNSSTPDIGADEFTPPPVDAGITAMIGNGFCAGTINTDIVLFNFATDTLKTVKIVREVAVNGGVFTALDTLDYVGLLPSGKADTVNLGTYTIGAGSYVFKFYTYKPNTFNDPNKLNDTLTTNTIQASMEGTYTVGGTSPDYTTLSAAVADLKAKGLCDAVRVEVREGTYSEQVSLKDIVGLSATKTLEIVSAPSNSDMPVITFAGTTTDNYVIELQGVSHVTLDSLEIVTSGTTYSRVLSMDAGVSNINVTNCKLVGMPNAASTSNFRATVYINGVSRNVLFDSNTIMHGAMGIYSVGSSSSPSDSFTITNNMIDSFYYYGIYSTYQNNALMTSNIIKDDNTYSSPRGIYALYNNPMQVTNNQVYIGGSSAPNGMYLDYNDGTAANPTIISNNMISMYSTSASGTVTGMEVYNAEHNIVANNSIAVYGGSASGRALYLYASGSTDTTSAFNNALANFGSGYALYTGSSTSVVASDYNNLYAAGANLAYWGSAHTTLASLQTASGYDANSVNSNPAFISSMDLHAKGIDMNNQGLSLAYVSTDIDGDVRSSTPDIGADEYTPPANDIAVLEILNEVERCAVTSQEIRAVITNLGTNSQSSYTVSVNITGAVSQTLSISGSTTLATGDIDTVSLGSFSTAVGGIFHFEVYTSLTNDEDLNNDTTTLTGIKVDALPSAPIVTDMDVCIADAGSVRLEARGGAVSYAWFDSPTSTTVLSTDSNYTVSLSTTDTFYVQGNYASSYSVGPVSNAFGAGGNYTSLTDGLVFDVANPIVLDSLTVYPNGAGNVVINIVDGSGTTFFTKTIAVTASGANRIAIDATIPAGSDYKMNAVGTTTGGLYRNSASASMPYGDAGNNVSIKNTINNLSGFYYFWYDWAITAGGCSSPLAQMVVNVNETVQPTIANDTICKGDDAYLHVTSVGNQITWYASPTATTPIAVGYSYIVTNVDSTTSFFVKDLGANGCNSIPKEVKVVVKATPEAPIAGDVETCSGEIVTLTATGTTGALSWYSNANGGSALALGNSFTTPALSSTKVYYVSETIAGCKGPREDVIVNVKAIPAAPTLATPDAICGQGSVTLSAISGSSIIWYKGNITNVVGSGNTYTTSLSATDTFYAINILNGCISNPSRVIVTVNPLPGAPVSSDKAICAGTSATLTATSTGVNTWYDLDGNMLFIGDAYTTPVLSKSTFYRVAATSGDCESGKTTVRVAVSPNVDADKSVTICQGESIALAFDTEMTYNWYEDASTFSTLATGATYVVTPASTDTFYAQVNGGNCTDTRSMFIVSVDQAASLTSISGATICEGETASLSAAGTGTISWYASSRGTTELGTGATFITPALTSTAIYYAEATNGTCVSDRLPAIITVNPAPNANFVAADHGNRVFVSASETNSGFIHSWTIGDTTIENGGPSTFVDGSTVGTVVVTHTVVNSITGCTSTSTAEVTVGVASVKELSLSNVSLYPNPNTGSFMINLPKVNEVYSLRMLNIAGQEVYSTMELTTDNNAIKVNVPAGMYFVQISDGESNTTVKVIVE